MLDEFVHEPRVAYFSMEIALRNEIPTYAGGLGVLAGDTLRSAVDLMIPMVAVSLVSRAGYFQQQIDAEGRQIEQTVFWQPEHWAEALDAKIAVQIEERTVWVSAWLYVVEGHLGGRQPVLLLDTDLNENHPDDREITHYLYGGNEAYRLKQEIVLGIGGVRLLLALGFDILHYHMNEGILHCWGWSYCVATPTRLSILEQVRLLMICPECAICAVLPRTPRLRRGMTVFHTIWYVKCTITTLILPASSNWQAQMI
jgi:glucan phosphorylase